MQLSHYSNWNYLSCKAIKIMIKTQMLLWKSIEGNRSLRVRVKFLLFYSELVLLTCDATCSRLYLDRKNMRRQCQMNTFHRSRQYCRLFPCAKLFMGWFFYFLFLFLFIHLFARYSYHKYKQKLHSKKARMIIYIET